MLAIQVGLRCVGNEELAAIGIRSAVSHRQSAGSMGMLGEFIRKGITGVAPAGASGVSPLSHKVWYYPVECGAVIKTLTGEKYKIVDRHRYITGK